MDVDEDSTSEESEVEPQKKKVRALFCISFASEPFLTLVICFFFLYNLFNS